MQDMSFLPSSTNLQTNRFLLLFREGIKGKLEDRNAQRLRRLGKWFVVFCVACGVYLLLQGSLVRTSAVYGSQLFKIENKSSSQKNRLVARMPFAGCNKSMRGECQEHSRIKCLTSIRQRIFEIFKPHFKNAKKVALIDVALHPNIGDTILWRSAIHLATLFGHSIQYICCSTQFASGASDAFPKCTVNGTIEAVLDGGLVLYQGGGNWGDLYRHVQDYRMNFLQELNSERVKHEELNLHVVSLPQTILYSSKGKQHLLNDKKALDGMTGDFLSVFARDTRSFDFAKTHYSSNLDISLSPDLAFVLGPQFPVGDPIADVLMLVRSDSEIQMHDKWRLQELEFRFNGTGLTFLKEDWGYTKMESGFSSTTPTVVSEVRLNAAIRQISRGRVVVTNRLHASIIANLIGRPLFWFDTKQKKLERTRSLAFQVSEFCTSQNLNSVKTDDLLSASEAAIEYLLNLPN